MFLQSCNDNSIDKMDQFFAQGYTCNKWGKDSSQSGQPGFPGGSVVKNLPVNAGDSGSIPGLG